MGIWHCFSLSTIMHWCTKRMAIKNSFHERSLSYWVTNFVDLMGWSMKWATLIHQSPAAIHHMAYIIVLLSVGKTENKAYGARWWIERGNTKKKTNKQTNKWTNKQTNNNNKNLKNNNNKQANKCFCLMKYMTFCFWRFYVLSSHHHSSSIRHVNHTWYALSSGQR